MSDIDQASRIARLNDSFRATFSGGRVYITAGVWELSKRTNFATVESVQGFNDFTPDNDPYGEHDFGVFYVAGHKLFWKIDYYDHTLNFSSKNPADPDQTVRVLTIMLAEEY